MASAIEQARWIQTSVGVRALDLGLIRVTGEDARVWLNGQVTNDVVGASDGDTVYALCLSSNGRILSDLHVLVRGDALELLVPRARLEELSAHLDRYIVMEDVDLASRCVTVISAQGPRASELLERGSLEGFSADRVGWGGIDLLEADLDAVVARAEELGGGSVSADGWELARLRAGHPAWGVDFGAKTFPQEAGLAHSAVSFTKGCYVGQEVVCMLENRGQLRRRLVQLRGPALPEAGAGLTYEGKEVGTVCSGVLDPEDGSAWVHAVVKRIHAEPGVELEAPSGLVTIRKVLGSRTQDSAL